jgi:hypothetical protein
VLRLLPSAKNSLALHLTQAVCGKNDKRQKDATTNGSDSAGPTAPQHNQNKNKINGERKRTCKHAHISLSGRSDIVSARHGAHEVEPDLAAA